MKFIQPRPYSDPANAAQRLIEIAKTLRVDREHMPVGEWNGTFLKGGIASPAEYGAGRDRLIADGVIQMHECGSMFRWNSAYAGDDLPGTSVEEE
jgi:hypothetical protein